MPNAEHVLKASCCVLGLLITFDSLSDHKSYALNIFPALPENMNTYRKKKSNWELGNGYEIVWK